MKKFLLTYKAVVEKEVMVSKEVVLSPDEYNEMVSKAICNDSELRSIFVGNVDEYDSDEINDLLINNAPRCLRENCVSMTFNSVQLQQID